MAASATVRVGRLSACAAAACFFLLLATEAGAQSDAGSAGGAAPEADAQLDTANDAEGATAGDTLAWPLVHRRYSGRGGSTGGFFVADPDSGEPGSLRLQLVLDGASSDDFLREGSEVSQSRQALSASWTPLGWLEIFGSLQNRGVSSDDPAVPAQHALGQWALGGKAFAEVAPLVHAGGGVHVALRDDASGDAIDLGATSVTLQGALSIDLREAAHPTPFVARLDLDYLFDNSAVAVEDVEAARYEALVDPLARSDEDAHLVTRFERYALGVSRIDRLTVGLGFEAPLEVTERMYVHPIVEWRLGVPVNRQGYDCPIFPGDVAAGTPQSDRDGCVAIEGFTAWPMRLTVGARIVPPVDGLSLALAVDWGLTATDRFVHELAPSAPVVVLLALGFDLDARPEPPPAVVEVAAPAPARGRVRGVVQDAATGSAVAGAHARVVGSELGPLASDADGRFTSEPLAPGEVVIEVMHERYAPARCVALVPEAGGEVEARCELSPLPKHATFEGRVVDVFGAPVAGAHVSISGASTASFTTDPDGRFDQGELTPGGYAVRVETGAHLTRVWSVTIAPDEAARLDAVLIERPPTPRVRVRGKRIVADALRFAPESTTLDSDARMVAAELADLLLRAPELGRIRVTAGGEPALSLSRARAVLDALTGAGVPEARIDLGGGSAATDRVEITIAE